MKLTLALLLLSSSAFASTAGKNLFCSLGNGNDEYTITITPQDGTWPAGENEGTVKIDFAGYRIGRIFMGTYATYAGKPVELAAVADGDATTVIQATLDVNAAKPVLHVSKGPDFVAKQGTAIPCEIQ
jgi:hypothetical protein